MTTPTDTRTSDVEPRTDDQIVEEFLERHNYFDPLDVDPDTRADARWLRSTLAAVREEAVAEERSKFARTVRRKMLEWSSQYHLEHFDRTLSHQSGMAVGYSAATKAVDNLVTGIEAGAPLDEALTPPKETNK